MIPVAQTNPNGRGNCMAACWSSILEIPIDEVPDYRAIADAGGSWMNAVNTWLSKHHDRVYVELEPEVTRVVTPRRWHLINYGNRESGHAVVGFNGHPMWDPEVSNTPSIGELGYLPKYIYSYGLLVDLTDELRETWARTWPQCLCRACIRGES